MADGNEGRAPRGPKRKLTVEELAGGATMDPRTGTIGGPDGPSGVVLTDGGAAGEPYAPQGKDIGKRPDAGRGSRGREGADGAEGREPHRDPEEQRPRRESPSRQPPRGQEPIQEENRDSTKV
jgi:hypothetical protein